MTQASLNAFDNIEKFKDQIRPIVIKDVKFMQGNKKVEETKLTETIDRLMNLNHAKHNQSPEELYAYKPNNFILKDKKNHHEISHDAYH